MHRWLWASTAIAGIAGLAGLLWLGTDAWPLVVPLAGLAAVPLLPSLRACPTCRSPPDAALGFCPGCARQG